LGGGFQFKVNPQQALGHNSKAVHHACSKHAEVTVPSLDDWDSRKLGRECHRVN
jgi:hypothetical protein